MRSGSKFRFCLQWGSENAEKIMAGQLLERLGNKKSEFIVTALVEYVQAHPELAAPDSKIQINVRSTQSKEQLQPMVKELVKTAVEELMAGKVTVPAADADTPIGPSQDDLDAMLENLNLFR